jgi:6-methylsalicylate decarboxylase
MPRIDTHHHIIPPVYRKALAQSGIADAGRVVLLANSTPT